MIWMLWKSYLRKKIVLFLFKKRQKFQQRLETLIDQGEKILESTIQINSGFTGTSTTALSKEAINLYTQWVVSSKTILNVICGKNRGLHYEIFLSSEKRSHSMENQITILKRLIGVLRAALDDLNNGLLIPFKQLVQAEVFDSELDQAKHFLDTGYITAAAVTAGVVLETAIRELCKNHEIELYPENSTIPKKLDVLNAALKKADVYGVLQQKRITALADIRNSAAHGNTDNFNKDDVADMIRDIERFLLEYLS